MMVWYKIIQLLFFLTTSVCYGDSLKTPYFKVSGMSDQLPNLCAVDYQHDTVNISIEVMIAACDSSVSNTVTSVKWTFHKLQYGKGYEIDIATPHRTVQSKESAITSPGLGDADLSIYAIVVEINLSDFENDFTIMGYLVVGCGESVENYVEQKCENVKDDVKKLAAVGKNVWDLRKCGELVSSYKATSTEEFDTEATYDGDKIYEAHSHLQVDTTLIFQVRCRSDANILLQEKEADEDNKIVEVVIGRSNLESFISTQRNKKTRDNKLTHDETDILSVEEFRYFWISFAGNEVRVGKGHIPYVEQFLIYDKLDHLINYISFGNGNGVSGSWKFDIDLCHLPVGNEGSCKDSFWGFKQESSTCEKTCDVQKNCFQTKDLCQQSCNASTTGATNCNELQQAANGNLLSGTYTVTNSNGDSFTVYCQFYSGYGYTFISTNTIVDVNMTSLFDDTTHVMVHHKRLDGNQYSAKLEQLSRHSSISLLVQYNGQTGYQAPVNIEMTPYIYIGFIPISAVNDGATEGWRCNGEEKTFTNCRGNPNSYIVFLFNQAGASYTDYKGSKNSLTFCWYDSATEVLSDEYLPDEFFTAYFEIHHGGCGGYGKGDSVPDIAGATVGLKFVITCATPSEISYGTKSFAGTSIGSTVTYSCDSGFVISSGDATRTCTDSGGWSGILPVCQASCIVGEYYDSGLSKCEPCPEGRYQDQTGQTECNTCPTGTTTSGTGSANSNQCIDKCSGGLEYVSDTDSCEICAKGTYRQKDVDTECKSCKTGYTTEGTETASEEKCVPNCQAGQFYDNASSKCELCPSNTYQPEPYKYECKVCPKGTGVATTGSEELSDCKAWTISIRCIHKYNCLEKIDPKRNTKFAVDCAECTDENVESYLWEVNECEKLDILTCNGVTAVKTTSKIKNKLTVKKADASAGKIIRLYVTVKLKDGRETNASELLEFGPIPVAGDCLVEPVSGFTLLTDFNITCINFAVEGNYSFEYLMKSKTVNEWRTGTRLIMNPNGTVTMKLPLGDPDREYRLFILVRAKLVESGAYMDTSRMIQVLPADQASDSGSVLDAAKSLLLVTNDTQSSPIDELIAAGNQAEAIQNLIVISSALNPVNISDVNATDVNDTLREEKTEIRTTVVKSLEKVNVTNFDEVSTIAQTLNEVTKVKTELSESTQELAADLFDNLADSLESYNNVTNVSDVVDSAGDIFTGVTQLLDIKMDEGSKHLQEDTKINDTEDTQLAKVKNSTGKLLNTINKIGSTLLSSQKPGDPAIIIQTESVSVQVEKVEKSALSGRNLSVDTGNDTGVATLEFPSVLDGLDDSITDLGLQVLHMKKNPYVWDRSAAEVNMEVLSVELTSGDSQVSVTNLSQPVKVTLKTSESEKTPYRTLLLHIIKSGGNLTYDLSVTNMLTSNFTIPQGKTTILSLFSFFQIRHFKIYIDEYEKPTFDKVMKLGVTYPDEIDELSKNFSKFEHENERTENSSLIFLTYNHSMMSNYTSTYYLAVTLDLQNDMTIKDLEDLDRGCIGNDTVTDCKTVVEVTLHVDTTTLACTYWDEPLQTWSNQGCEVSPFSTRETLECLCTHLTAFSGGVFVLPNIVDPIGDAALFLTFFDNPVVVTAVIIVWVLYFFLIHWARQSDRKDQEQVGVTAVADVDTVNKYIISSVLLQVGVIAVGDVDAVNKYMYLVCVVTGWWTDAGTTANVFFYMKGINGSSSRIKLSTSARLCFQSGYEDWFLVTTEEPLGDIQNVTLWHDNSGTSPHWYLSQIFVKDLQEKKSWTFIYNDWLAVDRGSALLTTACVVGITKEELKLKQKHNFMVKTTQDLRDSHLWISIFSKPARSTFTRVQRVTCALSLLLTTMLTNIMFYGIPTDDPDDQVGGSRGVVISLSSIVIGIQSSLIMFPVNVIIMQMFLKLKQRPVKEDIDKKSESHIQLLYDRVSHITTDVLLKLAASGPPSESTGEQNSLSDDPFDIGDESVSFSTSAASDVVFNGASRLTPLENFMSDIHTSRTHSSVKYEIASSKPDSSKVILLSESKQTGKILPWWFLYISWFLVLSVSLVSSYFVMLYGLKYGYQRSVEWLVSFLTGFSQSALITQPLKVLAVAVVLTLIFKRTVEFDDYGPEVSLDEDTVFVNSVNKAKEKHIPFSQPLSTELLQKIKERVQLEWLMDITLRDIVLYIIYIAVVCIVVHGHRDIKEAYYNSVAIEDVLVNPGCILLYQCFFLASVHNVQTFYRYMYEVAIPNLADMSIADHEYATPGSSHFLIAPWRLRQLRIDTGTCGEGADKLFHQFNMNVKECSGPYWLGDEEKRNFKNSWREVLTEASDPPTRWTYQSAWKLKTIPFKGTLATYSGGGYLITMPSNASLQEGIIKDMWDSDWIDERTRAIFLEFTLYNPNADLFSVVIILFEFSNNGAIAPYHQIFSTRLYHYSTGFANFVLVCECLFLIFNISFTYIEWKKFGVLGRKKYFEDYWSYVEIIQIALAFSVVGLFFQRLVSVNGVMKDFREGDGSTFISFYTAISWDFILGYVMAFLVALVTLKAIKLLKFNKRTYMVADTIAHSKSSIASFLVLAIIVAIAFGHFATMAFGRMMDDYRDMMTSLVTVFNFSLGVSDFVGLQETNRILGPIYFCIFVFMITFIFLTVFVAILNFGINESKTLFEKRQNKFELLDYVKTKLKYALNIKH